MKCPVDSRQALRHEIQKLSYFLKIIKKTVLINLDQLNYSFLINRVYENRLNFYPMYCAILKNNQSSIKSKSISTSIQVC